MGCAFERSLIGCRGQGQCDGRLRPNVVLFDEMLPEAAWEESMKAMGNAELVVIIGTSLNVYPANRLPSMAHGKMAVINIEPTGM